MGRLFGTDGIRGVANLPPMTAESALAVGRAVTERCGCRRAGRPRIVVGRDTRLSGVMLESALVAGVCSAGGEVLLAGVLPTPGVAFLTREENADAGVVISASHNPFEDNGIKIFSGDGTKLSDSEEESLEGSISRAPGTARTLLGRELGSARELGGAIEKYAAFCMRTFPGSALAGTHVVLDCANGATYQAAPQVFLGLGARVTTINREPDGTNINADCGSEHTEGLSLKVRECGARAGLAFDGDGDRLVAVDEDGARLSGDQVIAICARMYKERGWLDNNLVVTTVMSNLGLVSALRRLGIEHVGSQVGDRYVLEAMKERRAVLGGEDSGHIIFSRHHTTGDGLVAALQLLGAMEFYGEPLSQLAAVMTVLPQAVINVPVATKPSLAEIPGLDRAVAEAEEQLGDEGRVLVRYSGTQSMCRVMVEGRTTDLTERHAASLAEFIQKAIGASAGDRTPQ